MTKRPAKNLSAVLITVMLLLISCSCVQTDNKGIHTSPDTTVAPAVTTLPDTVPAETTPAETTPAETTPAETTPAPEMTAPAPGEHTVYKGAIEQFFLPVEDWSYERPCPPEMIMIHFTSAVVLDQNNPYDLEKVRNSFIDYEVSINYVIDRDGTVYCYVPEDRGAWHAGKGSFKDIERYTDKMNYYSIGIELLAIGSRSDMSGYISSAKYDALDPSFIGYTDAQYESLSALVSDICERYGIEKDRDHVIGHEEYSPRKSDPGELFDWSRIICTTAE